MPAYTQGGGAAAAPTPPKPPTTFQGGGNPNLTGTSFSTPAAPPLIQHPPVPVSPAAQAITTHLRNQPPAQGQPTAALKAALAQLNPSGNSWLGPTGGDFSNLPDIQPPPPGTTFNQNPDSRQTQQNDMPPRGYPAQPKPPPPPGTEHAPPAKQTDTNGNRTDYAVPPDSPFAGNGLFTSWDASAALQGKGHAQWVAIDPAHATQEQVAALRAAGFKIIIWQAEPDANAQHYIDMYQADGYIAQAEGPEQLAAAEQVGASLTVPKALVSNNFMTQYPPGWVAMPEAYQNDNPQATIQSVISDAQNRGATQIIPIAGNYGGGSTDYSGYQGGVGSYIAEEMTPAQWAAYNALQ